MKRRSFEAGVADVEGVVAATDVGVDDAVALVLAPALVAVPASVRAAALASSHALSYKWRYLLTMIRIKRPVRMMSWQGFCFFLLACETKCST
ncbi:hypothetical protein ABEX43_19740 [Brevibacillus porteri]